MADMDLMENLGLNQPIHGEHDFFNGSKHVQMSTASCVFHDSPANELAGLFRMTRIIQQTHMDGIVLPRAC